MKKFLPFIIFIAIFTGFLASQVALDFFNTSAQKSSYSSTLKGHYESLFQRTLLKSTKGTAYNLKKIKSPIIILNFWASWCTPCLHEFPSLNQLVEKFGDKVTVLGINSDEENQLKEINRIEKNYELKFESYADKTSSVLEEFKISALPVSIIFVNGKVIEVSTGRKDFMNKDFISKLENSINK